MIGLPNDLFSNLVWRALQTKHRHFSVSNGDACRYPFDVAPFAALASPTTTALQQLASLLVPNESLWLFGEQFPPAPDLHLIETLPCLRMVLPNSVIPPSPSPRIVPLSNADAPDMVTLTDLAFPGFFRPRTCQMGSYFGVRLDGELIAMCGERIMLDGYSELSGLCTHPAHRGKGYAANLIWELVRKHRRTGDVSWMHVTVDNRRAIDLYRRMGFIIDQQVTLHRVSLKS